MAPCPNNTPEINAIGVDAMRNQLERVCNPCDATTAPSKIYVPSYIILDGLKVTLRSDAFVEEYVTEPFRSTSDADSRERGRENGPLKTICLMYVKQANVGVRNE